MEQLLKFFRPTISSRGRWKSGTSAKKMTKIVSQLTTHRHIHIYIVSYILCFNIDPHDLGFPNIYSLSYFSLYLLELNDKI